MTESKEEQHNHKHKHKHKHKHSKVPITLLSGFLGAGKTTLLKHILETKHKSTSPKDNNNNKDGSFKCAVIVNDMAEINIDKALIDQSSVVHNDEVISMKNGCVCCNLKNDLMKQIIELAQSDKFEYIIIEASGVSEPAEIANIFRDCEEDHDHEQVHGGGGEDDDGTNVGDVARLDTCVTVVDSFDFHQNMQKIGVANRGQTLNRANLLVEQIEYANVILLNKTDLVNTSQVERIHEHIRFLNPKARVLTSSVHEPLADVMQVVNTNLFRPDVFHWKKTSLAQGWNDMDMEEEKNNTNNTIQSQPPKSCCQKSQTDGKPRCCGAAAAGAKKEATSELSTIRLGEKQSLSSSSSSSSSKSNPQKRAKYMGGATRHATRFGISSFLYSSKYPFHPTRFHRDFAEKYFVTISEDDSEEEDDDEEEEEEEKHEQEEEEESKSKEEEQQQQQQKEESKEMDMKNDNAQQQPMDTSTTTTTTTTTTQEEKAQETKEQLSPEELEERIQDLQIEATAKQNIRTNDLGGQLIRSKGFLWIASMHDLKMTFSQAGSMVTIDHDAVWNVLSKAYWTGSEEEKAKLRKDVLADAEYGDRRQELVFIGIDLNPVKIQKLLDRCLMTKEEYSLGVDGWKATIGDTFLDA